MCVCVCVQLNTPIFQLKYRSIVQEVTYCVRSAVTLSFLS